MLQRSESVESVRRYYDALREREWTRLTGTVRGRVSLELHRRFVRPCWRVLEIGAGPGRFTLELAALGCRIVVTDVSEVQPPTPSNAPTRRCEACCASSGPMGSSPLR